MSVYVKYRGRCGNMLFKYASARLFAERHGTLLRSPLPDACAVKCCYSERALDVPPDAVVLTDKVDLERCAFSSGVNYLLDGWFQRANYYMPYRHRINSWFALDAVPRNDDDLVVHVRLGDYYTNWADGSRVIHPSWYAKILDQEKFRRLYVVTAEPTSPYLRVFNKYNPTVPNLSEKGDFDFLRRFSRMVIGNSTFSWWAWFLGHGKTAYTFKPWVKDPQVELTEFDGATAVDGGFDER